MTENEYLKEAGKLIQQQKIAEARTILDSVKNINPKLDALWFLYAFTVNNKKEAIRCLRIAIEINPLNDRAWDQLEKLEKESTVPAINEIETNVQGTKKYLKILKISFLFILLFAGLGALCSSISFSNSNRYSVGFDASYDPTLAAIGIFLILLSRFFLNKKH
jgi:hypothetical protein